MEKEAKVRKSAKKHYSSLPYHNWGHAQTAAKTGAKLADRCEKHGIPLNKMAVVYALYFHDAGYHEDHTKQGFDSKEAYSSDIAERELTLLGFPAQFIEKVRQCITATHKDAKFDTVEEKIVRAADLAGIAGSYKKFAENNEKLRNEFIMRTGKHVSEKDWIEKSKELLDSYLSEDIKLTPEYYDKKGKSKFHSKARKNVERLVKENKR